MVLNFLSGARRTMVAAGVTAAAACGAVTIVTTQQPADAASACTDGSRTQAAAIAATGQFTEPRQVSWLVGNNLFTVKLRYNAGSRCAWGLISRPGSSDAPSADVWVDRSFDGGRTWQGLLGYSTMNGSINNGFRYDSGSTYTGVYNDAGVLMRACGDDSRLRQAYCTSWY